MVDRNTASRGAFLKESIHCGINGKSFFANLSAKDLSIVRGNQNRNHLRIETTQIRFLFLNDTV
jgi:hypothetical protein